MATERIAIRQDTASNWEAANPTLASGEQGHESDTGRRKIGDGDTAWNELGYIYGTAATKDTGTGADEVPQNSDLGTAATADTTTSATDTTEGRVTRVGDGGLLGRAVLWPDASLDVIPEYSGIFRAGINEESGNEDVPGDAARATIISMLRIEVEGGANASSQILINESANKSYFRGSGSTLGAWQELYHTGNVTVDGDGFLKEASPIIRLYTDSIEEDSHDGATLEHPTTGVYRISGTEGFAQEGWYIENYKDANGNVKCFVEYEYTDGVIEVRTYEPTGTGWRAEKGAPMDIHEGRYITLRLHKTEEEASDE